MCKPCKAELAKYKSGGALTRRGDSPVNLYQDSGILTPTKTSERTIDTDKFSTSNILNALTDIGTDQGTMDAYRERYAGLDDDLIAEQNRVASVRENILPNAVEMTRIADYIDTPGADNQNLATEQYQEIMDMTRNYSNMTLGEQKDRLLEMNKNMHPDLRKLFPNEGRSKNNNIFTFTSQDNSPLDGPPATAPYTLPMNDSLMCIGSVCGAFQEAGANIPVYAGNENFMNESLAGRSGFTSIPFDQAGPGDVIQQAGRTMVDYRDRSKGYKYRPHHAGIIKDISDDGTVSAYNAKGGYIDEFGLSGDFLRGEDPLTYRYTGKVPSIEEEISNFEGDAEALRFLLKENPEIPFIKSLPLTPIDHNFPKEVLQLDQIPIYVEPSNFWNKNFKTKNNNAK